MSCRASCTTNSLRRAPLAVVLIVAAAVFVTQAGLLTLPAQAREQRERNTYEAGARAYREKNYDLARDLLNNYLRLYQAGPFQVQALFLLGEIAFGQGKFQAAYSAYDRLLSARAAGLDLDSSLIRLIQSAVKAKHCAGALPSLQTKVVSWPQGGPAAARYWLAECYLQVDNFEQAAAQYQEVLNRKAKGRLRANTLASLGWALQRAGNIEEAIGSYKIFVQEFPRSPFAPEARFRTARLQFQQQRFAAAASTFRVLLGQRSARRWHAEALYWAAECSYALKRYAEARERYSRYLQRYKRGAKRRQTHYGLGWAVFKLGEYTEAERLFGRYANVYTPRPQAVVAYYYAGMSALAAEGEGGSLKHFARFLRLAPRHKLAPEARRQIVGLALSRGRYDLLELTLSQCGGAQGATWRDGARSLADHHFGERRYRGARRWWLRSLQREVDPTRRRAVAVKMALSLTLEQRYDAALRELLVTVRRAGPKAASTTANADHTRAQLHARVLILVGERAAQNGQRRQAARLFHRTLVLGGDPKLHPSLRFRLAVTFDQLGLSEKTEASLKEYLASEPNGEFAQSARVMLAKLYLRSRSGREVELPSRRDRRVQALNTFLAARQAFSESVDQKRLLGITQSLLEFAGAGDRALAFYRSQQFRDPLDPQVALRIGQLLLDAQRPALARRALQQARAASEPKTAAAAHYWLAEAYLTTRQYPEARRVLKHLLARFPNDHDWQQVAMARLGLIEETLGNVTKAHALYSELGILAEHSLVRSFGRQRSQQIRGAAEERQGAIPESQ